MIAVHMICKADHVIEQLLATIHEERLHADTPGPVLGAVVEHLLPAIHVFDPSGLMRIGMRAVIRDIQEWCDEHTSDTGLVDTRLVKAYLLAILITAGGSEDPSTDLADRHDAGEHPVVADGQG